MIGESVLIQPSLSVVAAFHLPFGWMLAPNNWLSRSGFVRYAQPWQPAVLRELVAIRMMASSG